MPKLKELEGDLIIVLVFDPSPGSDGLSKRIVKLISVDEAGIWVEDQQLANDVLSRLNLPAGPLVPMFFPYSSIHAIVGVGGHGGVSLSEKAFGA